MTKQMFDCQEKPDLPGSDSDAALAMFLVGMELSRDDCAAQLDTIENHLEINGVTITDVLVEDHKPRKKVMGIF